MKVEEMLSTERRRTCPLPEAGGRDGCWNKWMDGLRARVSEVELTAYDFHVVCKEAYW